MSAVEEAPAAAAQLESAGLDPDDVARMIRRGLEEDLGTAGDLTSAATVTADARLTVTYTARQPGTVAGLPVLALAAELVTGRALDPLVTDGAAVDPGTAIARLDAAARDVLVLERLSLNLLGHLSGVATVTRRWVDAVAGTGARIRDTRKTTPGLRDLEKYAVRCGGGVNHRRGLDDGILVKDNHLVAAGGVTAALDRVADALATGAATAARLVQLEVDDLDQLDEALQHPLFTAAPCDGSRQLLCDNFALDALATAVSRVRAVAPAVAIEASGGLTLDRAAAVAATGVDYLAVGALTHSAPGLDIGLDG
jgi:nicotinate-nucleotide pyrophosphorylase (carboxylating)